MRSCALPDRDRRSPLPDKALPRRIGDLAERGSRLLAQDWPADVRRLTAIASTARPTLIWPRLRTAFSRTCQNSSDSAFISAIGRLRAVGVAAAERLGRRLAHHPVLVGQRARDRIRRPASCSRRRARSPPHGEHARPDRRWPRCQRGDRLFELEEADHADRLHANRGIEHRASASSAGFSASCRRSSFSARSALMRTNACVCATSGRIGVGARRVLQFGHAVGRGGRDRLLGIDQQLRRAPPPPPVRRIRRARAPPAGARRRPDPRPVASRCATASDRRNCRARSWRRAVRRDRRLSGARRCRRGRHRIRRVRTCITATDREC